MAWYELDTQLEAVGKSLEALRFQAERTQAELPEFRRLTLGLSLSASLLAGIILL